MRHGLGLGITAVFLLPIYWIFIASLRQPGLPPPPSVEWLPQNPTLANYPAIFDLLPMTRYIRNSLLVVAAAVPLTLYTASLAGFGLSQETDTWRRRILLASVGLLLLPGASVWIFRFQLYSWLGLIDNLWALIVPAFAASNPLYVLLFFWGYRRVPTEMIEAARLDGASALRIWWSLARPLVRPTSTAVSVLAFVLYWSDFVSPVLYIYRPQLYTLPIGLQILRQVDATNWPLLMAAAAVMTAPVLIFFVFLQRSFLSDFSIANLMDRN